MIYFRTAGIRSVGTLTQDDGFWTFKTKRESLKLGKPKHILEVEFGLVFIGDTVTLLRPCKDMVTDGTEDDYKKEWESYDAIKCPTQICGDYQKGLFCHDSKMYWIEKGALKPHALNNILFCCLERYDSSFVRSMDVTWVMKDNTVLQHTVDKKLYSDIQAMCTAIEVSMYSLGGDPLSWKKFVVTANKNSWDINDWEHALCVDQEEVSTSESDSDFAPDDSESESEDESEEDEDD